MMSAKRQERDIKNRSNEKSKSPSPPQLSYIEKLKSLHSRLEDLMEEEERVRTDIKNLEEIRKKMRETI